MVKNNRQLPAKRRAKRRNRRNRVPRVHPSFSRAVRSQWDAFAPESNGAKQFDANSALTNAFQARKLVTVTTDANGAAALQIAPFPANFTRVASAITSDVVSTDGSWGGITGGGYVTNHEAYRVVSFGVKVRCIAAADTAAGLLRVNSVNTPQALAAFSDFASDCDIHAIQQGLHLQWYAKPRGTHIHDFLDGAATIAGLTASAGVQGLPTTACDIFVSGGPASTPLLAVEIVLNLELLPIESDANTSQTASKSHPFIPEVIETVSKVARNHPHVVEGAAAAGAAYFGGSSAIGAVSSAGSSAFGMIEGAAASLAGGVSSTLGLTGSAATVVETGIEMGALLL